MKCHRIFSGEIKKNIFNCPLQFFFFFFFFLPSLVSQILFYEKIRRKKYLNMLYAEKILPRVLICVEVLRPSQPNGVMSSAVSLPNHTFTGQA